MLLAYLWAVVTGWFRAAVGIMPSRTSANQIAPDDINSADAQFTAAEEGVERWEANAKETEKKLKAVEAEYADHCRSSAAEYAKLEEAHRSLQAEKRDAEAALNSAWRERDAAAEGAREYQQKFEEVQGEAAKWREQAVQTSRELKRLRTSFDQLESLLDTRTAELRDAQAYLTKSDTVSDADVRRMVEDLNAQIYQLSASITAAVATWGRPADGEHLRAAYDRASLLIGAPIMRYVLDAADGDDHIWAQLGLQAVLAVHTSWLIAMWDVRLSPEENEILRRIHVRLFEEEPQSVSARWRALGRRHVGSISAEVDVVSFVMEHLTADLERLLFLAGAQDMSRKPGWIEAFDERIRDIVIHSVAIQRTIGEEVISGDFKIVCPRNGDMFSAGCMEDVDDCGRSRKCKGTDGGVVLCTTELGLRRFERLTEADGTSGLSKVVTVVKAKVALPDVQGEL